MYNHSIVSAATKKVLDAARKLAPEGRAEVAHELLESLQGSDYGQLSPAWEAEIDRRIKAFRAGRLETIPAEQVYAEIEEQLQARRSARWPRRSIRAAGPP